MKRISVKTVTETRTIVGNAINRRFRTNFSIFVPRDWRRTVPGAIGFVAANYDRMRKYPQYYAILS
ncbi:hypothetical protein CUJ84_pRLN2000450 (plasmid) [Rhizobium leguminosarum]|uniref:Uncharacterized protein n=1 Tax=Rhizobium leguminosarum TaxID=384 RepID=A0A2K9ZFK1_RHILE|nr:hypothetical protein CUJ84_pRLN2000450 [Rhizobium leguminosarum]